MRRNNNFRRGRETPIGGAARKVEERQRPFPGLIDDNRWKVIEASWPAFVDRTRMDTEGGIMGVPFEDTPVGRKIRLHEQAHVAWTPSVSPEDVVREEGLSSPMSIMACEDARILEKMNALDPTWKRLNHSEDVTTPSMISSERWAFENLARKLAGQEVQQGPCYSLLQAAQRIVASRRQYESHHYDEIAGQTGLEWLSEAIEEMHERHMAKGNPTFEDTIAYARELEQFAEEMEQKIIEQNEELGEADMPHAQLPRVADGDNDWGEMSVETVPLPERLRGISRKTRSTDEGSVPRYIHRLPVDQRVFGRKRKQKRVFQGTVLIDHSGSMSLAPEEVDEILARWPAVTIATYSGTRVGGAGRGVLRIIAKNGRRAALEHLGPPSGSDNMVDGPALDWLAKQKKPRLWISDGYVTGTGGSGTALISDAAKKVIRGGIKRIENVRDLLGT